MSITDEIMSAMQDNPGCGPRRLMLLTGCSVDELNRTIAKGEIVLHSDYLTYSCYTPKQIRERGL